jgi:hypothetical protein
VANATRWYATREATKAAVGITGAKADALIDDYIESASESVENLLGRRFIPQTQTRLYPWPQTAGNSLVVYLDQDLLAVTTLLTKAQNTTPTEIAATDFFLEPVNKPPYQRIEIDRSSSSAFEGGDTSQRSISVAGRWGYSEDTKTAGLLAEADDGAETELNVSDSSLIDVGDTILLTSEALFVSGKALLDTTANTNGALTAVPSETSVTVTDGSLVKAGEIITINSERMLVESIAANVLTVERAYDGSVLAAHNDAQDVYAPRTLTVVRAVNGTTAAAHADALAITKYAPPADVVNYTKALALNAYKQGGSGWTGQIGGGEGTVETRMAVFGLTKMRDELIATYGRVSF